MHEKQRIVDLIRLCLFIPRALEFILNGLRKLLVDVVEVLDGTMIRGEKLKM